MFKIQTYNQISPAGLDKFPRDRYEVASEMQSPDAILLRSHSLHGLPIAATVKAVGRAGAGVNNIPVAEYSRRGIPVFNAPGANANAVKELVIAALLLAARNICPAWDFTRRLEGDDETLHRLAERGKSQFAGFELAGKTLGVLGLGAIGVRVANTALELGMQVVGFDPLLTVESAWQLSSRVGRASSVDDLLGQADMISLHVPLNEQTRHIVNASRLAGLKTGASLLNFSRAEVVEEDAVLAALDSGRLHVFVSDFPTRRLLHHPKAIVLPHLGASTAEAEDHCAAMVVDRLRDFLENGNIRHAVNFPDAMLPRTTGTRLGIANDNVPNMVGQITSALAAAGLNIVDLLNKSRGSLAYTLVDLAGEVPAETLDRIRAIDGVLSARLI